MTRAVEIRAPSGETEGTRSQILRWLKRLGESVAENEPLIEIETDKVTVELASPGSGVLREILKQEQEEIAPGELLGRIESGAAAGAAAAAPAIAAAAVVASAAAGTAGAPARRGRRAGAGAGELSPAVSRLLRERGLDAAAIRGTGPGGRVTVEDVLRGDTPEPRGPGPREAAPRGAGAGAEEAGAGADAAGEIRRVPHTALGLNDLVTRARAGELSPADLRGGTFTISNHGVSGSLLAAPIIINQPQSAILGVGKLEKRPVVVDEGDEEKIVVRPRCYVTLTLDHRVMDGHRANRFLEVLVQTLGAWPA